VYPDSKLNLNYETKDSVYFFTVRYEPLNSWSPHRVEIWGEKFMTVEHGYHFRKYRETSPDVADQILAEPSPWAALQLDRQHKALRRADWHSVKVDIMRDLMRAKLEQNDDVRECLKATGAKMIVENSPWDRFWGCGADGSGENTLGRLWVELRANM
jgi:N-glycosidase YbiA